MLPFAGSSPRVRGREWHSRSQFHHPGIIPAGAGAGLTGYYACRRLRSWDHPRGCGAHAHWRFTTDHREGSSPRVRGSPCWDIPLIEQVGIIPAGAGLTSCRNSRYSSPRDHPRGCGAHHRWNSQTCRLEGSSPRVRGSLCHKYGIPQEDGIIPAGAGLTSRMLCKNTFCRDHPRGCGAHCR